MGSTGSVNARMRRPVSCDAGKGVCCTCVCAGRTRWIDGWIVVGMGYNMCVAGTPTRPGLAGWLASYYRTVERTNDVQRRSVVQVVTRFSRSSDLDGIT